MKGERGEYSLRTVVMYYINPNVNNLNRIFDQNSREGFLRLDLNENPGGLPAEFIKKTLSDIDTEFVAKYPETEEQQAIIAKHAGVKPENICLTNGSTEAIRHTIEAYTRPGGKIVSVTPAYAMYEVYANMYGRVHVPVPYKKGFKMDANDILDHLSDDVDMVVIQNPNNPIGDTFTTDEVQKIIDKAREHEIFVLIDEAYYYFNPTTLVDFAIKYDHVILTRTFSKLFSLAGARLGYAIGQKEEISMIQKLCSPHNVNAFALKFATEIIETPGMIDNLVSIANEGKTYLIDSLRENGYFVNESNGNFVFIETKTDAAKVVEALKDRKILTKFYKLEDEKKYLRVTIGSKELMSQFLKELFEVDK